MNLSMIIAALVFAFSTYSFATNDVELRFTKGALTNLEQCWLNEAGKSLSKGEKDIFTGVFGRSSQNAKAALLSIYVGNDLEVTGYHLEFISRVDWEFVSYFGLRSPAMDPQVAVYFGNQLVATVNGQACLDGSLKKGVGQPSSGALAGRKFCRTISSDGSFGQPSGKFEHCVSFSSERMTDNANVFFGNPPEIIPYRISGAEIWVLRPESSAWTKEYTINGNILNNDAGAKFQEQATSRANELILPLF